MSACNLLFRSCLVSSCLAAVVVGQQAGASPKTGTVVRQPQAAVKQRTVAKAPDPQLRQLISDAEGVSPEFRADLLLSLAESGKIANPALIKSIVNRAYSTAQAVDPPYAEAPYGSVGTTPAGRRAVALSMTQLDRMSLQSRAVHDMQAVSPARARAMFESMPFPSLGPLGCSDNWVYDPGPFYAALTEVVELDFRQGEIAEGRRLAFLMPYVSRMDSHAQVIPTAHLLATAPLTPEEMRRLSPAFAEALSSVPSDEHTFSVIADDDRDYVKSVYGGGLSDVMSALLSAMRRSDVPTALLLRSLRSYLVQNFNGSRCDIAKPQDQKKKSRLPKAIDGFNQTFDGLLRPNGLGPIGLDELPKAGLLPTHLWDDSADDTAEAKQLTVQIRQLRASLDRSTKDGRVAADWWRELEDFLVSFDAWQEGNEAEADYVREKGSFYQSLVQLVPNSPQREKILEEFVRFLDEHSSQSLGGAEWFIYVKLFLLGMYAPDFHDQVIRPFLNSRDPVLNLYARLELWNGKKLGPHWPAGQRS